MMSNSSFYLNGNYMKKCFCFLAFMFCVSNFSHAQFLNFNTREIIFFKSLISESRFKQIWLTNQSAWKLSRPTTFVNLSEIFIILNENDVQSYTQGIAFINGHEYEINYLGGQFFYDQGFLYKVINKFKDGSRIMLDDYSEWDIEEDEYKQKIINWFIPKYVVLDQNKKFLIDPQSQLKIKTKPVE